MLHTGRSISYIIFPWLPTFDITISSYFSHTNNCFKLSKFCFIIPFLNDVVHLFMCSFSIYVYPFWLDVFCCPVFCICSLGHASDTHSYLAVPSVFSVCFPDELGCWPSFQVLIDFPLWSVCSDVFNYPLLSWFTGVLKEVWGLLFCLLFLHEIWVCRYCLPIYGWPFSF